MKVRNTLMLFADILFVFLFIFLLIFPQYASVPTRDALSFCAKTLIPSLFVYMVLSKIIISLPIISFVGKRIGIAPIAFVIGFLCGCPIGAKNAVTLYESGKINKKYAEYLCSFTNNVSLSFVIGFVGAELFGDIGVGLRLALYQLISALITAFVMKYLIFGKSKLPKCSFLNTTRIGLREAIADSALTMLNICACAVFFIVIGNAIGRIFTLKPFWDSFLKALLEFSTGCQAAIGLGDPAMPMCAFSIGFTGLSVALQVRGVIAKKLAMRPYLLGKLLNASLITLLAVIFG